MSVCIRFIADRSFVSRAIRFRTDGDVSHVEFVSLDASGAPIDTFGAHLQGGVIRRPYDYCKPTFEEWYTFPGVEETYQAALGFAGEKYNVRGIFHLLFGVKAPFYDPRKMICSILVGYANRLAWAQGKAPLLLNMNVPTWQMTPQLLYAACTQRVMIKYGIPVSPSKALR